MDDDESQEEFNLRIRKSLCEWFGTIDELQGRVNRNLRHGLIRSKMKSRSSPYVSVHVAAHESPIPVQVALQSMRNLVEEPLSALPTEFHGLRAAAEKPVSTESRNSGRRRRNSGGDEFGETKRKKEADGGRRNENAGSFSPDFRVHSTENEVEESSAVEAMLNIMTSLGEPKLSPIPENFLRDLKTMSEKKPEEKKKEFTTVFNDDSSTSSASTSREPSPISTVTQIKLKDLKSERLQKLLELAKKRGKLTDFEEEKEVPTTSQGPPKLPVKTMNVLTKESVPSPRSISSNTPTQLSRPSSSMSTHEKPPTKTSQQQHRWTCQWEHAKLTTIQRVPIPDPTKPVVKSKAEFYHTLAKDWKSKADKSKDRVLRPLDYMLSSVFFVLEAIAKTEKERTQQARMGCASIYRDTYELLGLAVFQGFKETDDTLAVHILPRIKILGQIMLSVMQYQMYLFRSEQAINTYNRLESREVQDLIEVRPASTIPSVSSHTPNSLTATNKHITTVSHATPNRNTSAGSTPSSGIASQIPAWLANIANSSNLVTMPQVLFDVLKSQMKTSNSLILASRYWEDSKSLAILVDVGFLKHIETVCGRSLGIDMPFEMLAQFVLTAVGSLKAEYEEEQKLSVKPDMTKVKKLLDIAIKTGTFHQLKSDRPPSKHPTSTSTPAK